MLSVGPRRDALKYTLSQRNRNRLSLGIGKQPIVSFFRLTDFSIPGKIQEFGLVRFSGALTLSRVNPETIGVLSLDPCEIENHAIRL